MAPEAVAATDTLQYVVDERILRTRARALPVADDGRVIGLISTSDITRIPRERWATARVADSMVSAERIATVEPAIPLPEALHAMQTRDVNQLPVVQGGRLVGMLTRADVRRQLEVPLRFEDLAP